MPHDDPDPTDPMMLNAVTVETDEAGATREMAVCFIEELLRMGHDARRVLAMFNSREYSGPFMARQVLGETEIKTLIEEQMRLRGKCNQEPPALAGG